MTGTVKGVNADLRIGENLSRRSLWFRLLNLGSGKRYAPVLQPSRGLQPVALSGSDEISPYTWSITGCDPIFDVILPEKPNEWVLVEGDVCASQLTEFKLYIDNGSGFSEATYRRLCVAGRTAEKIQAVIYVGKPLLALRLDPGEACSGQFHIGALTLQSVSRSYVVWHIFRHRRAEAKHFAKRLASAVRQVASLRFGKALETVRKARHSLFVSLNRAEESLEDLYARYIEAMEPSASQLKAMAAEVTTMAYRPVFSIAVPVYNIDEKWLRRCVDSVRAQIYPNWELCLADDASTKPHVRPLLEEFAAADSRIKVAFREQNGHISAATNTALELATGDYMCLMDNDDEIPRNALYEFAVLLNRDASIDMIYSDEDKLNMEGERTEPFFKPDWSPETLEGCMYTAHFACYRMSIVRALGGFRSGFDGAQDYDFVLRFTELARKIVHVPKILYHWRAIPGSTAATMEAKDYVVDAAVRALTERVQRVNGAGRAWAGQYNGSFEVRYAITGQPLVSIIIPSAGRDAVIKGRSLNLLVQAVQSISQKNTYRNFEIIIVDNGDLREHVIEELKPYNCRFIHYYGEFNIATKMNMGAAAAKGEHLLFMNDDIEVINDDWMECLLQLSQRDGIGAVGAKLFFEDGSLQHVGVAFWLGLPDHIHRTYPGNHPGHYFSAVANRNYLAVTGAVMMTKRKIFEEIGGFDEGLAVNYNDIDYCLKVVDAGHRVVWSAGSQLYHYESLSRERTVAGNEIDLFLERWAARIACDPYYGPHFDNHPPNFILRSDWALPNFSIRDPLLSTALTDLPTAEEFQTRMA